MRPQLKVWSRYGVVLLCIIAVLTVISCWQAIVLADLKAKPPIYSSDGVYVKRAISLWTAKNHAVQEVAMKSRYAIAVHVKGLACIQLTLKPGSVGGNPVYCFDRSSGQLRLRDDNVE